VSFANKVAATYGCMMQLASVCRVLHHCDISCDLAAANYQGLWPCRRSAAWPQLLERCTCCGAPFLQSFSTLAPVRPPQPLATGGSRTLTPCMLAARVNV
jgi:hypothetical protein